MINKKVKKQELTKLNQENRFNKIIYSLIKGEVKMKQAIVKIMLVFLVTMFLGFTAVTVIRDIKYSQHRAATSANAFRSAGGFGAGRFLRRLFQSPRLAATGRSD